MLSKRVPGRRFFSKCPIYRHNSSVNQHQSALTRSKPIFVFASPTGLSIAHPTDAGEAFRVASLSDAAGHDRQFSRRAPWNERFLRARAKAKRFARFLAMVSRSGAHNIGGRSPSKRRNEGRIGRGGERRSGDGIAAPCNRFVGSHGGEAPALFATAEAGHRSKLRRLSNRRQLLWRYIFVGEEASTHREKGDLFRRYACMIQIGHGAGRLVEMTAANQEINAASKARFPRAST